MLKEVVNMNKNESFNIKALMNGYKVEYGYRAYSKDDFYNYQSDEYLFLTWAEVVDFISNKPLDVPPAKIVAPETVN